jgi:uncharacterized membrane protein
MKRNLNIAIITIILGMLSFVFSPQISAVLLSLIFGKQWDVSLIFSLFISTPFFLLLGIILIIIGLSNLRKYFKQRNNA